MKPRICESDQHTIGTEVGAASLENALVHTLLQAIKLMFELQGIQSTSVCTVNTTSYIGNIDGSPQSAL